MEENTAEWLAEKQPDTLDPGKQEACSSSGLTVLCTKSSIHYLNELYWLFYYVQHKTNWYEEGVIHLAGEQVKYKTS